MGRARERGRCREIERDVERCIRVPEIQPLRHAR